MKKEIVEFLLSQKKPSIYEPGEIIFSQNDTPDVFYYFISGLSLTYTVFADGRERNILITWPDRIFGASTFFEGALRRASAIAIKRCEVLEVNAELYQSCCEYFPEFRDEIILEISRDLGVLFDELADASLVNADVRVGRFLCRRLANGQHSGTEEVPVVNFTQDFIADVLGLSRVSVSQAMSTLAAAGWISIGYGKITIRDKSSLRRFSYVTNP